MSCLFNSLSYFFQEDSNTIRQLICNYLEKNGKIIEGLDTEIILSLDNSKSEYITQMRDQTTWGGAIEIQAACNLWNVRILVHNIKYSHNINIIEFLPINNTNYKGTINITWNGTHYEKKDNF